MVRVIHRKRKDMHTFTLITLLTLGLFDQEDINKLKKECRIISHLDHPNVLSLIGICLDDKVPYLIMPLMERGSVLMYLRKERQSLLLSEKSDKDDVSDSDSVHINIHANCILTLLI